MLSLRCATIEDARYVGTRLRVGDAAEVAMFGVSGVIAIEVAIAASVVSECLLVDGEPAAVLGLHFVDLIGAVAQPWILTTDAIERHRIGYARAARALVERAFTMARRLENIVDPRYTRAINLLQWIGFTVEPEENGVRRFWMEKN